MREAIAFEASRSGYAIDQIADGAMTVGELIDILSKYDEDMLFVLSHDNGYTYGSISRWTANLYEEDEDGNFNEA